MHISRIFTSESASNNKNIKRKKEKFSVFEEKNTNKTQSATSTFVENLSYLNYEEDKDDHLAHSYCEELLQLLSEYRNNMIFGKNIKHNLEAMSETLNQLKPLIHSQEMQKIMSEIELLTKVELAKNRIYK